MKFIDWYLGCSHFRETEIFNLHRMFARIQYGINDSLGDLHDSTRHEWHRGIQDAAELDRAARTACIQMANVVGQK